MVAAKAAKQARAAQVAEGTGLTTTPLRGVAAGQTMVLYRPDPEGDEVIASATIA